MTALDRRHLITALRAESDRRGWRDPEGCLRSLVDSLTERSAITLVTEADVADSIPAAFVSANRVDRKAVADAFWPRISASPPMVGEPIIAIDAIETFAAAGRVSAQSVAGFSQPLPLPERAVKLFIAATIGEPYIPNDWGGEGNDLFTPRVRLRGRTSGAAFLLKGSGTRSRLRISGLGKNGDQIVRLCNSPAELLVVQHVGEIDEAVRVTLQTAVIARRALGQETVGSVWDGADCARLFVASGFLDADTGELTTRAKQLIANDRQT